MQSKDLSAHTLPDYLPSQFIQALLKRNITSPTPIQTEAWPILFSEPTDFIGLAATGTGKTLAFAVPLLNTISPNKKSVQAIVLCPTRELAMQVEDQIQSIGKSIGIRSTAVYGGSPYPEQIRALKNGVHIVVGTPGRVIDHIERRTLDLSQVKTLVLDEADEMISMGFQEDLETIVKTIEHPEAKKWMFCATLDRNIKKIADKALINPKRVQVNQAEKVPSRIEQFYILTPEDSKPLVITRLIDSVTGFYGIIFCQTKATVNDLVSELRTRGYKADTLHGDMDQNARERTLKAFRERKTSILVCTDVAARGIDVQDITHVINYSLPRETESYVHRIGRTARSGKTGIVFNLVSPSNRGLIKRIEFTTQVKMKEAKVPTVRELAAKKLEHLREKLIEQENHSKVNSLLTPEWKEWLKSMDSLELAARWISYSMLSDLNKTEIPQTSEKRAPSNFNKREERGHKRDYPRTNRNDLQNNFDRPQRNFSDKKAGSRFDNRKSRSHSEQASKAGKDPRQNSYSGGSPKKEGSSFRIEMPLKRRK